MLLLATFLSWGWPKEKTIWISHNQGVPTGLKAMRLPMCCGSMLPAIHGGELGYWEVYTNQTPLAGFIVDRGDVTHRVTAETKDAVLTSGDANKHSDGWVSKSKIRWVLRYVVR